MNYKDFVNNFKIYITENSNAELAYGRLSVGKNHLFEEAGLFWYERTNKENLTKIQPESLIALKRGIFRISQYFDLGKKIRWNTEKLYAQKMSIKSPISRNSAMNTDIHILWPLYGTDKDILQESFIPKEQLSKFIEIFKKYVLNFNMNILNVTIREVTQDNISLLSYANTDVFGVVCLFSQNLTSQDEEKMENFTKAIIDEVIRLNGTFYLPYRLHYNINQLQKSYPSLLYWLQIKEKWDQDHIFSSEFFEHINNANL